MELREFDNLLASHDWFYDYSDDYGVWQRGMNQARLIATVRKLSERHEALYEIYRDFIADNNQESFDRSRDYMLKGVLS